MHNAFKRFSHTYSLKVTMRGAVARICGRLECDTINQKRIYEVSKICTFECMRLKFNLTICPFEFSIMDIMRAFGLCI